MTDQSIDPNAADVAETKPIYVIAQITDVERNMAIEYAHEWNMHFAKAVGRLIERGLRHTVECQAEP